MTVDLTRNETLISYREIVEEAFICHDGRTVMNGRPEHASVIHEFVFKDAATSVNLFCEKLSSDVFGNKKLIESVKEFLAGDSAKLNILVKVGFEKSNSILWNALSTKERKKVIIKEYNSKFDDFSHFSVNDNNSFRYESSNTERKAIAIFGEDSRDDNILFSQRLSKLFTHIWTYEPKSKNNATS